MISHELPTWLLTGSPIMLMGLLVAFLFWHCRRLSRRLHHLELALRVHSDAGASVGRHVTGLEKSISEVRQQVLVASEQVSVLKREQRKNRQQQTVTAPLGHPPSTAESKLVRLLQSAR